MDKKSILISVQRALLGMITCNMKAITIGYTERSFSLKVYFEYEPNELELELLKEISTEVIADFPKITEVKEIATITKIKANKLERLDEWAYVRFEE